MTFSNDECDYCHTYVDPIGGDTAHHVNDKYWCGQCRVGRDEIFADMTQEEVVNQMALLEFWLAHNPPGTLHDPSGEDIQRHLEYIQNQDLYFSLRQVFVERFNGGP